MTLKERNEKIMSLINSGSTYQQAADAVGVTRSTVAGVVRRERQHEQELVDIVMGRMDSIIAFKPPRRGLVGRIVDWVMART